jgi:L-fuconolactonase
MRIDAHQHFWDYAAHPQHYVWMTEDYAALRRDFGPDDLRPLLAAAGIDGTVAVQARELPEETDYLLALAAAHPFVRGVVGWLDLCDPGIEPAIAAAAANPRLKGLRMLIHDRADADFAASAAHVRGVGLLARYGLAYDLLLRPPHLSAATALADRLPDQVFVLDHIAKPDVRAGVMEPWRSDLARLAERPNVACKLSSLTTQADWTRWGPAEFVPYLDWALECFGPLRLMIGSDWPVCTVAADYGVTIGVVRVWAERLGPTEAAAILGGTAARVYRLEEGP